MSRPAGQDPSVGLTLDFQYDKTKRGNKGANIPRRLPVEPTPVPTDQGRLEAWRKWTQYVAEEQRLEKERKARVDPCL